MGTESTDSITIFRRRQLAPILVGAGATLHSYTGWDSKAPEILSAAVNQYSIFPQAWRGKPVIAAFE